MQESNQRKWHRVALTAKPIWIAGIVPKCFPGFEPPFLLRYPASSLPYRLRHLPTAATRSSRFFRRRRRSSRSPYVPLPAQIVRWVIIDTVFICLTQLHLCIAALPPKKTITGPTTGAGWGPGGERLKAGMIMRDYLRSNERLCGQRIPQPLSLVRFLCGHKK